jgi:dihydroneopterin aldolase
MKDTITLHDIELWTRIGHTSEERVLEQRIKVTVAMQLNTKDAGQKDDLDLSVNYAEVLKTIQELAKTERALIERMAEDIAQAILQTYAVASVTVTVFKCPLPGVREVSISITRPS